MTLQQAHTSCYRTQLHCTNRILVQYTELGNQGSYSSYTALTVSLYCTVNMSQNFDNMGSKYTEPTESLYTMSQNFGYQSIQHSTTFLLEGFADLSGAGLGIRSFTLRSFTLCSFALVTLVDLVALYKREMIALPSLILKKQKNKERTSDSLFLLVIHSVKSGC